jgi:hypothetical protein
MSADDRFLAIYHSQDGGVCHVLFETPDEHYAREVAGPALRLISRCDALADPDEAEAVRQWDAADDSTFWGRRTLEEAEDIAAEAEGGVGFIAASPDTLEPRERTTAGSVY